MRSFVTPLFTLVCVGCAADGANPSAESGDEAGTSGDHAPDPSTNDGQTSDRDSTTPGTETTTGPGGSELTATDAPTMADASDTPEPPAPQADCHTAGDDRTTLVFVNRCAKPLTVRGSDMEEGQLAPGATLCRNIGTAVEELPAKRYWAFAGEDPGNEHYTLAEFTFNTDFNDFDWYNISHVDAFNLPMQIVPLDEPDCKSLTCGEDLLEHCPAAGQDRDDEGNVVVCVSPDRDDGESEVAVYFESCDDAYAWSGDDQHGEDPSPVAACAGEDWQITFCPE